MRWYRGSIDRVTEKILIKCGQDLQTYERLLNAKKHVITTKLQNK